MRKYRFQFLRKGRNKKIFDLFLSAIMAIFFVLNLPSIGTSFERVFQVNHEATEGNSVFPLSDGYLVLTNHQGQQNFTKFDLHGNMVFSKDFFDASGGWPRSATQTSDGGYLIAGLVNTTPKEGYLIKLDQHLEAEWGKEFSQKGDIWVGSAKETSDGGYISLARGDDFIEIIKLKSDSSLDWQKRIMTEGETEAYDIYEVTDGTKNAYVIYGELGDSFSDRVLLLGAVEKNGNAILWQWAFRGIGSGGEYDEKGRPSAGASNILQMDGSNFVVAASAGKKGNGSIHLISFSETGHLNSFHRIDGQIGDSMGILSGDTSFIKLSDGNFLLSGYSDPDPADKVIPSLIKLRSDLNGILWQYTYLPGDCFKNPSISFTGFSESSTRLVATGKTIGGDVEAFFASFSKEGANDQSCLIKSSSDFKLSRDLRMKAVKYPSQLKEGIITSSDIIPPMKGVPLAVNPGTIDFGVVCGGSSATQRVTFTNSSTTYSSIAICSTTIVGSSGVFQMYSNACTPNLLLYLTTNPRSCDIDVVFSPPTAGSFSGNLSVCYSPSGIACYYGPTCEGTYLTGTGGQPLININPTAVNFGNVCVGSYSEQTVTVQNMGDCPINPGTSGSPTGPFSIVGGSCSNNQTLNPGGSCTVIVRFTPTSAGSFNSGFAFSSGSVMLTGTGRQQNVTINPSSVNLGNVCIGSYSEQTVTVQNAGDCLFNLGTIGLPAAPFSIVGGTCSNNQVLNPGGSCTVIVRFTPTSVGSFNSGFAISVVNAMLTGISGQQHITVNPTDVDFANVAKGKKSDKIITVTNAATCPFDLTLKTISVPGAPFSIVGGTCTAGEILKMGERCSIIVRFSSTQAGSFASSFNISSDDPGEPTVTVNLTGGSGPDLVGELASPLIKQCRNTWRGVQCTIKAVINIKNIGTNDAPPCCVQFYLSGAEGYQQSDPLLMQSDTNGVKPGKGEKVRFTITLPPGETGVNKFLTIVLNGTHCFIEANEANNIKSYLIPK